MKLKMPGPNRVVATIAALWIAVAVPCAIVAQQASIVGVVLRDSTERPLANAEVSLTNPKRSTRTDSTGTFAFRELKPGRHSITVRLIGYESLGTDLQLKAGETVEPEFILRPNITKLKSVDVKASPTTGPWAIKLQDFDNRRAMGIGHFLTADFFEKNDGRAPSAILLAELAGVKFIQSNGRRWFASLRGCARRCPNEPLPPDYKKPSSSPESVPSACYMQVVINGLLRYSGQEQEAMFDVDQLNTKDILGLELYTSATTPLQYKSTSRTAACGTVIIWTKGG